LTSDPRSHEISQSTQKIPAIHRWCIAFPSLLGQSYVAVGNFPPRPHAEADAFTRLEGEVFMRFRKAIRLQVLAFLVLLMALPNPAPLVAQNNNKRDHQHHRYKVIDLGTLGGTFSEPHGINNKDWVVGGSTLQGDLNQHAFLWRHGDMIDLGTLGGPNSIASYLNENGTIVGQAETSTPDPLGEDYCGFGTNLVCVPFVWQNGVMTPLPTLGGSNGVANSINARGQVAYGAETAIHDPTCIPPQVLQTEAAIWRNGVIQ
jgi:probable HAF family extracellular repeat protein